jgi:hypothetical protein
MNSHNGTVEIVVGKNDRAQHIFAVVVKRSYQIRQGMAAIRCEIDQELRKIDNYYDDGDPEWATVQYESELAPYKPAVDVVVIGKAYSPKGEPTHEMTASVRVGDKEKQIVVFGDRECHFRENASPIISDPIPFTEMEIRYERAYGGRDERSIAEIPFIYPRNHMGTGVALRNCREVIQGLPLPNLEHPGDLLIPERIIIGEPEYWPHQPLPQGFGWFQKTWYPRCAYAGVYPAFVDVDTITVEEYMGLLPRNHVALAKQFRLPSFDARFNNGASLGMLFSDLKGDEKVCLGGMSPEGTREFTLPGETPEIMLDIGTGEQQLQARLDTVSIRPDDSELDLIWRGYLVYEGYGWLSQMKRLVVRVQ